MRLREIASPYEVRAHVARLAALIGQDYEGRTPVLVCVLKGAFIFTADLARGLDMPVEVDFIRASSYGNSCVSSGCVHITRDIEADVSDRDVLVVEDIVDTGLTLTAIKRHIEAKRPASLRVCSLVDKPSGRRVGCAVDYVGMEVGDVFVVGYGLDCAELYRNLPGLYVLENDGEAPSGA